MTDSSTSAVGIALLLPDVLGTYADRGNAAVLAARLRWRGLPARLIEVTADQTPPTCCDVYLLGGGEDAAEAYAAQWLLRQPGLLTALHTAQVVAVCAGLQILGRWMETADGQREAGAGLVDVTTVRGRDRAVGEAVVAGRPAGLGLLTGFENHRGRTRLGPDVAPLGRVVRGTGNGDGTEGVLTPTLVGTYLHGPVLARNPALADLVLSRATGLDLPALHVDDEQAARRAHLPPAAGRRQGAIAVGARRRARASATPPASPWTGRRGPVAQTVRWG